MNDVQFHSFEKPSLNLRPDALQPEHPWLVTLKRGAWWSLLGVGGGAISFFVIVFTWLSIAPLPLGFMAGDFEKSVTESVPNVRVRIGDVSFSWGPGFNKAGFQLYDVDIYAEDGTLLVNVPQADMHFALDALLEATVAPKRVELIGLSATLTRLANGSFRVGVNKGPTVTPAQAVAQSDPRLFQSILEAMLLPPDASDPSVYLAYFGVREAKLALLDEATGTSLEAPNAHLALERGAEGVSVRATGALDLGGEAWTVAAQAVYRRGSDSIDLEASFSDVVLSRLAERGEFFAPLKDLQVPVGGTATGQIELKGALISAELWVKAGAGMVRVPALSHESIRLDRAELSVAYDAQSGVLNLESLALDAEGTSGRFSGQGRLLFDTASKLSGMSGEIAGEGVTIDLPSVFERKLMLDRLALRGSIDAAGQLYKIENATLHVGAFEAGVSGEIAGHEATALKLEGWFKDLKATDLILYWPKTAGEGARDWIAQNIFAGRLTKGVLKVDIPAGGLAADFIPDEQMRFDFSFEGLEANYITGLTRITGAKGSGTVFGDTFRASVESAKIGPLEVKGGDVHIPTLHVPKGPGNFKAVVEGRLPDFIALIDMEPLGYAKRFRLSPDQVGGTARVDLALVVPMKKDLPVEQISFDINAETGEVALALSEELSLAGGKAKLNIDGRRLKASGQVLANKLLLDFEWLEEFDGKGFPTKLKVSGLIDEEAQRALAIPYSERVNGPVQLTATLFGRGPDVREAEVTIGLTGASAFIKELNWLKPYDMPATAKAKLVFAKDGKIDRVEKITLSGEDIEVSGLLDFAPSGKLATADFPKVRLGPRNNLAARFERDEESGVLTLSGASFDAARILKDIFSDADEETAAKQTSPAEREPLRIAGRFTRLYMREGAYAEHADVAARLRGGELENLSLKAVSPKGEPIEANIATLPNGAQRIEVTSGDAGNLVKGVIGFKSVVGGELSLLAELNPREQGSRGETSGMSSGLLRIDDFRIVDQPFLARLFAVGSLTGISDLIGGSGITFHELELPFTREDTRWHIKDGARAAGPSLGITAGGYLDSATDAVAINGTMVPIYGVNSFLKDVPIFGEILTGQDGEGIFGMTYGVSGTAESLKLKVNPLSLIAPGFFREIFKYDDKPGRRKEQKKKPSPM